MKPTILLAALVLFSASASAQQSSRYRPQPTRPQVDSRQAVIAAEVNSLQQSSRGLVQVMADHLRSRGKRTTAAEVELQEALTELDQEVAQFVKDLQSGSEINHLYRTFHALEYGMQEAWALACEAGYERSLERWLSDADGHVAKLASLGFRNPRLEPLAMDGGFRSSHRGHQNDFVLGSPTVGNQAPQQPVRQGDARIDVGDALRRLFGSKTR
jgi:hypothetical protein